MTKIWPAIVAFLLWSAFALIVHQYVNNSLFGECAIPHNQTTNQLETTNQDQEKVATTKGASSTAFAIKNADGSSIFNFSKGLSINNLNGNVQIPEESSSFKDDIYNYLNKNQAKELLISTKHLASEVDTINGTHFGNSRVGFLKNLLVKAGVNPDKIISKTELSEFVYDENGNYTDGISMQFQDISDEHLAKVEEGISNKTLYSDFAVEEFKPDRSLRSYTLELKNYLERNPGKKIYIVGHTDSIGVNNYRWGLDRAFNVKGYLTSQGVAPSIIVATSKGEDEPIADNGTEKGRAKNRRIEITIK